MNRPGFRRKTALLCALAAVVVLGGCASHYPYSSRDGVYYGKSYDRYGYRYPYGHSSYYRYDYRVYDYGRGYWYRPYGYGYYGRHRRDDHDRRHDTGSGGEARAADELRRITDGQSRVRLDPPSNDTPRVRREKRETTVGARSGARDGGSIRQLRENRAGTRGSPRPTPAPRTRERPDPPEPHRDGGIVTPRERDR